jgi:hypothetical protein
LSDGNVYHPPGDLWCLIFIKRLCSGQIDTRLR